MYLTLPIQVGKQYVRRDGAVVTITRTAGNLFYVFNNGSLGDGYVDTGKAHSSSDKTHPSDLIADHIPATGHPHAALMAQYAADAAETAEPWLRWECRPQGYGTWHDVKILAWKPDCEYRRKPKTIRIGEHDVPVPLREVPEEGGNFWMADPADTSLATWFQVKTSSCAHFASLFETGLVHLTREAAEQHARALLAFTQVQA